MATQLRIATSDEDRAAVYALRYQIYVKEQGLYMDTADHERRWLTGIYDPGSHIFIAEEDGRAVGSVRLTLCRDMPFTRQSHKAFGTERFRGVVDEGNMAMAARLVVHTRYRGGSLGHELVAKMCELAAIEGIELIFIYCELHLVNYHLKRASQTHGALYNHPTDGVRVRMAIVPGDVNYLRRTRSPMFPLLSQWTQQPHAERIRTVFAEGAAVRSEVLDDPRTYFNDIREWLTDSSEVRGILGDLSREEAALVLARSHVLTCQPGDGLIRNGHISRTVFMLLEGSLEVWDQHRFVTRIQEPGTVIGNAGLGEMPCFSAERYHFSDVVVGPSGARILALSDRKLRELVADQSPWTPKSSGSTALAITPRA